jgi:hypothetical protein
MKIDVARFMMLTKALSASVVAATAPAACSGNHQGDPGAAAPPQPPAPPPPVARPDGGSPGTDAGECAPDVDEPNDTAADAVRLPDRSADDDCSADMNRCPRVQGVSSDGSDRDVFVFRGLGEPPTPSFRLDESDRHRLCVGIFCQGTTNLTGSCGSGTSLDGFCCTTTAQEMAVTVAGPCAEGEREVFMYVDPTEEGCSTYGLRYDF